MLKKIAGCLRVDLYLYICKAGITSNDLMVIYLSWSLDGNFSLKKRRRLTFWFLELYSN